MIGFGSLNLLENQGVQCTSTFLILKLSQCDKAREISHCSAVYYPSKHFTTGAEKGECQNYKYGTT